MPAAAERARAAGAIQRAARRALRPAPVAAAVLAAARRVYAALGWGWHEDVYREALAVELAARGHAAEK